MARILIVDDEEQIRGVLQELLELDGHEIVVAEDGLVAKDLFKEKFDLLVTDVVMPCMSGLELVNEVKAERPDLKVIVMSGDTALSEELGRLNKETNGVDGVIEKPFGRVEIKEAIDRLVN